MVGIRKRNEKGKSIQKMASRKKRERESGKHIVRW